MQPLMGSWTISGFFTIARDLDAYPKRRATNFVMIFGKAPPCFETLPDHRPFENEVTSKMRAPETIACAAILFGAAATADSGEGEFIKVEH
jgi:hypothetical protein